MKEELDLTREEEEAFLALEKQQEEMRARISSQVDSLVEQTKVYFQETCDVTLDEDESIFLLRNPGELLEILTKVDSSKALQYGLGKRE